MSSPRAHTRAHRLQSPAGDEDLFEAAGSQGIEYGKRRQQKTAFCNAASAVQ